MSGAAGLYKRGAGVQVGATDYGGIALKLPGAAVDAISEGIANVGSPTPVYVKGKGQRWPRATSYAWAFVAAPFVGVENGGVLFRWPIFVLAILMEYILSFVLAISVPAMASYASGLVVSINAFTLAATYAGATLFLQSWRTPHYLPHYLMPSLTFAENLHTHIGLIVSLPFMAAQLLGALTSAPVLAALGTTIVPNFQGGAPVKTVSYWGAVCLQTLLGAMCVYAYQFNTSFKHHHLILDSEGNRLAEQRGPHRGFKATSIFFAFAIFLSVIIGYGNGLWSVGNWIVTFGSYVNTGTWNSPDGTWTLDCIWWLASGAVGWAAHCATWNVNALTEEQKVALAMEETGNVTVEEAGDV
jgi:hypothetical protein